MRKHHLLTGPAYVIGIYSSLADSTLFADIVYQFASLVTQTEAVDLHHKTRLQHYDRTGANKRQHISSADTSITRFVTHRSCRSSAISFALIGRSQRVELDSTANSSKKECN
jgi:hypothetical protein